MATYATTKPTFNGTLQPGQALTLVSSGGDEATLEFDGTDMIFDVPASKGYSWEVDGSEVASISSAGAAVFASTVSSDGLRLATGKTLALNAGGTTHISDSSGDMVATVATGERYYFKTAGGNRTYVEESDGKIVILDGRLDVRATTYGHTFMSQTAYGGSVGYNMRVNPTDSAGNAAIAIGASATGGSTALANADLLHFKAGTDAGTLVGAFTKDGYYRYGSGTGGPKDMAGAGSPESAVSAPVGSTWRRTDGGSGTSFYVKESGTGNTGWVAK